MARKKSESYAGLFMVFILVMIALCFVLYTNATKDSGFSPLQPVADMKADYADCKANAPEGFDCIMQPVLVSEGFIIAETGK